MSNPNNDLERIHQLETDVTVLHRDSALHTKTLEKIDDVLDRVETHNEALNRTVSVYDLRLTLQDKTNDRIEAVLKETQAKLETFKSEIIERIDSLKEKHEEQISKKEKQKFEIFKFITDNWKPIMIGVAIVVGLTIHKWGLLTSILGM